MVTPKNSKSLAAHRVGAPPRSETATTYQLTIRFTGEEIAALTEHAASESELPRNSQGKPAVSAYVRLQLEKLGLLELPAPSKRKRVAS